MLMLNLPKHFWKLIKAKKLKQMMQKKDSIAKNLEQTMIFFSSQDEYFLGIFREDIKMFIRSDWLNYDLTNSFSLFFMLFLKDQRWKRSTQTIKGNQGIYLFCGELDFQIMFSLKTFRAEKYWVHDELERQKNF